MTDSEHAASDDATETASASSVGRRVLRGTGAALAVVVAIVLGGLLVLQTDWGATRVAQWAADRYNPAPGTTISVERASGSWLGGIALYGITWTLDAPASPAPVASTSAPQADTTAGQPALRAAPREGRQLATVDTLSVRYALSELIGGTLHLTDAHVGGPAVYATQRPDSTWNWMQALDPLLAASPSEAESGDAPLRIRVDRARVSRGYAEIAFYGAEADSTAIVDPLTVSVSDVDVGASVQAALDTLHLQGELPTTTAMPLTLRAAGRLSDERLDVRALQLDAPGSRLRSTGQVRLARDPLQAAPDSLTAAFDSTSFALHVDSLAIADLVPFVPSLAPAATEVHRGALHVEQTAAQWRLQGSGAVNTGGTWEADATARWPRTGDSLRYRGDIRITDYATRVAGPPVGVTARLQGNATGPTHRTLSGTATLAVRNTQVDSVRIDTLGLAATATSGALDWEAAVQSAGATLTGTGTAQPFADTPTYTADATLRTLAVQRWLAGSAYTSDLNARLQVDGTGIAPDTRAIAVQITMQPSTVNGVAIDALDLQARLNGQEATSDFTLDVPGGRLRGAARTTLDDRETFAIERLETESFNLNALLPEAALPDTRLTAALNAQGQGFDPATMQLDATASVTNSTYGRVRLDTLQTDWRLRDGALQAEVQAQSNAGAVQVQAEARPFDAPLSVALRDGRMQNVNIGPALQDTTQQSALTGTFGGRWVQPATGPATGAFTLALSDSKLNAQSITAATVEAALDADGQVTFDTRLRLPEGTTAIAGTARPFADRPTLELTTGRVEALNVGALAGQAALDTDLNGTLDLQGAGSTLADLTLNGRMQVQDSRINEAALPEATWQIDAEAGQLQSDLNARFDVGTVQAAMNANLADSTYTLTVNADAFDGAALTGQDSLRARLETLRATLNGRGITPETARFTAMLQASNAAYGPFELQQARLRSTYTEGRLALDTLQVASNVFTASGAGTVGLRGATANSDIALTADVHSLAPVQELGGFETLALERGRFTGRLQGAPEALRFSGQFEGENLMVAGTRIGETEIVTAGALNDAYALDRMEARTTTRYVNAADIPINRVQASGTYQMNNGIRMQTDVQINADRRVQAAATMPPVGNEKGTRATLNRLDVELDGTRWSLMQPVRVAQDSSAFQIRNFLLAAPTQQIAVDGRVDPAGEQNLGATFENVQLDAFASLLALEGLGGTLSGAVDLSGPAQAPVATAQLRADIRSEGVDVGTLDTRVTYDALALNVDGRLTHADGSTLTIGGDFPIDLRLDSTTPVRVMDTPVDLRVDAEAFAIGWVDPFLDPAVMQDLRGRMQAGIRIAGTRNNPDVQGEATLNGLSVVLTELGTRYRNGRASLRLQGNRIQVVESEIQSAGQGRLTASGDVSLEALTLGTIDLDVQAREFQAVDTRAYRRSTINGRIAVQGTTERPSITGTIQVVRADIAYDELDTSGAAELETVALTEADRADLERRFGVRLSDADTTAYDAYQAMAMDLSVEIRRETWLRSRSLGLNIQFSGDLDLQKAHDEDLELYGSIDIVPERSTVEQFGQVFRVDEGVLTFNGPVDDPQMTFAAVYEQRARETRDVEVAITLNAEGRLGDLDLNFSSEPPMSTANILSYLATGRPADSLLGGSDGGTGGSGSGELATQLAIGQASSFVENLAASQLGLDVVRLQVRPNGISYLTVGRYLTPRFYVSIEQPVDTGSSDTEVLDPDLLMEYELTRTLIARVLRRQSSLRFNLLYERAY